MAGCSCKAVRDQIDFYAVLERCVGFFCASDTLFVSVHSYQAATAEYTRQELTCANVDRSHQYDVVGRGSQAHWSCTC